VPERKRQIFDMRFGISSEETYTLCEVAARYGITKEAIRRVERDVINQLRTGPYGHALRDFHASH
ncbi:sigma factor-like helix-turn-helix DNA-binding protein, partial [Arthrospira platensis SPKY2]